MRGARALLLLFVCALVAATSAHAQAANQAKDQLHFPANPSAHEATKSAHPEPDFVGVLQAEAERKGIHIDWGLDHVAQKAQEESFKLNKLKSSAQSDHR